MQDPKYIITDILTTHYGYATNQKLNDTVLNGFKNSITLDDISKYFTDYLSNKDCNLIKISVYKQFLMKHSIEDIVNIIYNIYYNYLEQLSLKYVNKINFNILEFLTDYDTFRYNSNRLEQLINNNMLSIIIKLNRNILIYHFFVSTSFFTQLMTLSSNIEDYIKIYNLYFFYQNLSSKYNLEFNITFNLDISVKKNIINTLLDFINLNIKLNNSNIKKIIKYIYIAQKIEPLYFIINYDNLLTDRITQVTDRITQENVNLKLEKKLLKHIDFNCNKEIYSKMIYKITDVKNWIAHTQQFRNLKIDNKSGRYPGIENSLNKCSVKLKDVFAWSQDTNQNTNQNINTPDDINAFLDTFKAYYNKALESREINYNLDKSYVTCKMIFDKVYSVRMTVTQYTILDIIMKEKSINALDISKKSNIDLKKLVPILNNLLASKLITRQPGSFKDPTIDFNISINFKYDNINYDITNITNNNGVIKIKMFSYIKDKQKLSIDDLYTHIMKTNSTDRLILNNVLKDLEHSKLISIVKDDVIYNKKN